MKRLTISVVVAAALVLTGAACTAPAEKADKPNKATTQEEKNTTEITLDEFNAITPGMPYDQVVAIIGSPGKIESEFSSPAFGAPGDGFYIAPVSYQSYGFQGGTLDLASISFENGVVSSMMQVGLG